MSQRVVGPVLGIAIKVGERQPLRTVESAEVVVDGGIIGAAKSSPDRGVTFLSARQWAAVQQELGAALDWRTRRANVLIDAEGLGPLIGREVQLGTARLLVKDETRPCGLMDEFFSGLRQALKPECRGGVHARVIQAGGFRVGDVLTVVG